MIMFYVRLKQLEMFMDYFDCISYCALANYLSLRQTHNLILYYSFVVVLFVG